MIVPESIEILVENNMEWNVIVITWQAISSFLTSHFQGDVVEYRVPASI